VKKKNLFLGDILEMVDGRFLQRVTIPVFKKPNLLQWPFMDLYPIITIARPEFIKQFRAI